MKLSQLPRNVHHQVILMNSIVVADSCMLIMLRPFHIRFETLTCTCDSYMPCVIDSRVDAACIYGCSVVVESYVAFGHLYAIDTTQQYAIPSHLSLLPSQLIDASTSVLLTTTQLLQLFDRFASCFSESTGFCR